MCRHSHDRASAIGHHHIIRNPNWNARLIYRVDGIRTREHTCLFLIRCAALNFRLTRGLQLVFFNSLLVFRRGNFLDQRMFWREDHECRTPQRIGACRKYLNIMAANFGFENHRRAFTAIDPIGLQSLDRLGPVNAIEVQQFIGVLGRLEEPLIQILLDDRRAAAFAVTVVAPNLLACQCGIAVRAPIYSRHFAIG